MVVNDPSFFLDCMSSHQFSCVYILIGFLNALTSAIFTPTSGLTALLQQLPVLSVKVQASILTYS